MQWGIGSYSLAWNVGVPGYDKPARPVTAMGLLELAREYGVGIVQYADNMPLGGLAGDELDRLAAQAKSWGIALELGTRGTSPDLLLRELDIASRIGSPILRTLITEADLDVARSHIRTVLPELESRGITLAVENHGLHTTKQLSGLFDSLGSAYVGCCLDTVNSFGALEAPDTVIRALVPYIANLHLKDFDVKRIDHQMGFVVTGTATGAGRLDMDLLFAELDARDKRPTAIVELWVPYAGTVEDTCLLEREWLDASIAYMRTKLAKPSNSSRNERA
ncbi:sugar phosphate isomerase/epimerase family protein [Cohnella sp. GCM10027633]|uniref:sugar phosphate isomerase/epimerase family protein n=1 Tax=unclassified Cohnella TaxID=2636738 RepID=UPI0036355A1E